MTLDPRETRRTDHSNIQHQHECVRYRKRSLLAIAIGWPGVAKVSRDLDIVQTLLVSTKFFRQNWLIGEFRRIYRLDGMCCVCQQDSLHVDVRNGVVRPAQTNSQEHDAYVATEHTSW